MTHPANEAPRLRFLGAAGTVTGSRFLLKRGNFQILIDCGLYQGRKELRLRNWHTWPEDVSKLTAIILTHAHVDHSGFLPRLVKMGFGGPVYCTDGTAALLALLLPDSAHIQEADAEYANRKGFSKHKPALPLYTKSDAYKTLDLLRTVPYDTPTTVVSDTKFQFAPAGHLLGSASVLVSWDRGSESRRLLVSGDLGKYNDSYMKPPQPPQAPVDYLLIESTYGNRIHNDADIHAELARIVNESMERGGVLLIPSFAIGRTQEILFYLGALERAGKIPVLEVCVDSPMATSATEIYSRFAGEMNFAWDPNSTPLATARTRFTREVRESRQLASLRSNAIIISASGMATGGRVVHHLSQRVGDKRNTVMFAGFQVDGTRGRKLIDGAQTIRMFGQDWPVRAHIENFSKFSAHGDREDLLRWAGSLDRKPRQTFVVHGETLAAESLADALETNLGHQAIVPGLDASIRLP